MSKPPRYHDIGIPTHTPREGEGNLASPGVTVAFIVDNGAPIE